MSRGGVLGVLAAVAVLLVVVFLGRAPERPSGPPSSSYATTPGGVAAWAELLERAGHDVRRIRAPLDERPPSLAETVVLLDGSPLPEEEADALRAFARRGGRVIGGGAAAVDALHHGPSGDRVGRLPAPQQIGDGEVLVLDDVAPFTNRRLADGEHAAAALEVAGDPSRRIAFVESVHGYDEARGLSALPAEIRRCLWLLALAGLVFLLARGRRLGPAEAEARELPPPRRLHVDALAAALARTKDRASVAGTVSAAARTALLRRTGLGADATPDELRAAAQRLGLPEDEARAVTAEPSPDGTTPDLLTSGRALARLTTTTETT
jgi:hypothetical protein